MSDINHFDVVFVVDTTGSMGAFIHAAQRLMVDMAKSLAQNAEINMHVGVVEYRDHKPQDHVLTKVHQLGTLDAAQRVIRGLSPAGGGDGPEAVCDGIVDACEKIKWRKHSRKVVVLIGDAPPHGVGSPGDGFPKGCPCGEDIESVSAKAEDKGVTIYGLALNREPLKHFERIARLTGGDAFESTAGDAAVKKIQNILDSEFGNLALDRKVMDAWDADATVETVAEKLSAKPGDVAASYMRLMTRGLLNEQLVTA